MTKYLFLGLALCLCHFILSAQQNKVDSLIKEAQQKQDAKDYYNAASYWALAGNKQKAFENLEYAFDYGSQHLEGIQTDNDFNTLKSDKQWTELMQKITAQMDVKKPTYFWGAYFGILFILFFYNLFLYFSLKEKSFLFYSLFVYVYASLEATRTPQFDFYVHNLFFWVSYVKTASSGSIFYPDILMISYLFFARSFLNLNKKASAIDKWVKRWTTFFVLLTITACLISFNSFFPKTINYVAIISTLLFLFSIGIYCWRKGQKEARFFVIGNVFLITGSVWTMLYILKVISFNNMISVFNADNIGLVIFMLLLSFALGDKMNILKKETVNAQAKALEVLEEKVQERTIEIRKQKALVEEKNKDIIDSINYAKRIQTAVLQDEERVSMHLPDHFVLFKPKDIVSGDFHWAMERKEYFYLAAVDCTGHGVPGGFMSMLGVAFLNEITAGSVAQTPAKILNKLRDKIITELGQTTGAEKENKDGMDISLMRLNLKTNEIQWSGANNALYIVKNELKEINPDKQPIGYYPVMKPFTNHVIQAEKDSVLYLFTDGYADQFGGPKGKKFRYKQLQEKLQSISSRSMAEQKTILNKEFESWKGKLDQVDDVLIIGIRV